MYFDKDAIIGVGEVVFEGDTIELASTNFLNPTGTESIPIPTPPTDATKNTPVTTNTASISAHSTLPPIPTKQHHNSLTSLPQFDPQVYGCGKSRCQKPGTGETALVVEGSKSHDAGVAEFEEHKAMLAISENQLLIKPAINGPKLDDWK